MGYIGDLRLRRHSRCGPVALASETVTDIWTFYAQGQGENEQARHQSRWSPPLLDTRYLRKDTSALLTSWKEIRHSMVGDSFEVRGIEASGPLERKNGFRHLIYYELGHHIKFIDNSATRNIVRKNYIILQGTDHLLRIT
ncbi:hypothetical protein EVAR_28442_1 [Eumeta japonica]|uniref:Uncharacterized protein n=1 Tax=Eumeta variegata TaxID=151549 RepID=A0A4C1V9K6_EUMVA|nr:hypothetical protein EVAR_28442_1 [Eumeta japonica]